DRERRHNEARAPAGATGERQEREAGGRDQEDHRQQGRPGSFRREFRHERRDPRARLRLPQERQGRWQGELLVPREDRRRVRDRAGESRRADRIARGDPVTRRRLRAASAAVAAVLALLALVPPAASAHGLVGRADLPIPTWLFGWAAAIVLGVSFALLGALWRTAKLEESRERRLFRIPRVVDAICGAIGIGYFGLVVYAGFAGSDVPTANIAPTSIYVIFWVGSVVLSVLFGDIFRA